MNDDARFEDGGQQALRLRAEAPEDLQVLSVLLQDAVLSAKDMHLDRARRNFSALVNRFRWEDREAAEKAGRPYERTRAMLFVSDVTSVSVQGVDRSDPSLVLSILTLSWLPGIDGTGKILLTLAGDGAISLAVECLNVSLRDVTRPYLASSGQAPVHPE